MNLPELRFQLGRGISQGEQYAGTLAAAQRACDAEADADIAGALLALRTEVEAANRRLRSIQAYVNAAGAGATPDSVRAR